MAQVAVQAAPKLDKRFSRPVPSLPNSKKRRISPSKMSIDPNLAPADYLKAQRDSVTSLYDQCGIEPVEYGDATILQYLGICIQKRMQSKGRADLWPVYFDIHPVTGIPAVFPRQLVRTKGRQKDNKKATEEALLDYEKQCKVMADAGFSSANIPEPKMQKMANPRFGWFNFKTPGSVDEGMPTSLEAAHPKQQMYQSMHTTEYFCNGLFENDFPDLAWMVEHHKQDDWFHDEEAHPYWGPDPDFCQKIVAEGKRYHS